MFDDMAFPCQGGNKMSKGTRKISVAVVTVSLAATTAFGVIKANNIYDDSTIGLSSALDRYVESVQLETASAGDGSTPTDASSETVKTETAKTETKKTSKKSTKKEEKTTEAATEETETGAAEKTCKYPQFEGKCLTTVTDEVNIRATASADGELVGTLGANGIALVKEKGDTWTKVASGSCEGYIKNDFLVYGDDAGAYAEEHCSKLATVTTETLNVRAEADADSECLTMIPGGESYSVIGQADGWTEVKVDDETAGYVSSDYVEISYNTVKAISVEEAEAARAAEEEELRRQQEEQQKQQEEEQQATETPTEASTETPTEAPSEDPVPSSGSTGVDLANYALQFVGNPYVYGGTSLTNGADCSGFTLSVYAHFGISLPHSATAQSYYGTEVSLSELEPGDLLFYGTDGDIGHVGIYTGGGMIVHASTEATGIKTSVYNYRTPIKAVRLLGQ